MVLSVDGGGFRGLACLIILKHVMEMLLDDEDDPTPAPCEVFDLICGTSTGGLIAILLGRLGLDCENAIAIYKDLGPTIFGDDEGVIWGNIFKGERFSSAKFELALEKYVKQFTGDKDTLMKPLKAKPDSVTHKSCKTFVTVVSQGGAAGVDAYRVRSYQRPRGEVETSPSGHSWSIREAARGTSAAPMYFAPLEIKSGHGRPYVFQDAGASGFNNPAKIALDEAEKLFPNDEIVLISLGTGLGTLVPDGPKSGGSKAVDDSDVEVPANKILGKLGKSFKNAGSAKRRAMDLAKQLVEVATDTEIAHSDLHNRFTREKRVDDYFRFNPPRGLGDIDLADYLQANVMEEITTVWLRAPEGKEPTERAADSLKEKHVHVQEQRSTHELIL